MKRNYFEPAMKISAFSLENVVTTSAVTDNLTTTKVNADTYNAAVNGGATQQTVNYATLQFNE